MNFFTDFNPHSQDILEKVGQEGGLKGVEKGAKSEYLEFQDRFRTCHISKLMIKSLHFFNKLCFLTR